MTIVTTLTGSVYEVDYGHMRARKAGESWRPISVGEFVAGRLVLVWANTDDDEATLTSKIVEVKREDSSTIRFG